MAHKHRTPAQIWRRRWLYHPLQAALIYALLGLFRILPVGWASWLGSRLARTIAPLLAGPKRRARRTLDICFPDMADEEKRTIRSEEHKSELQSLMRKSYAVFCLKQKN